MLCVHAFSVHVEVPAISAYVNIMTRCNSLRNAYRFLLGFDIGRIFIFFIFYKFNLVNIRNAFVCKRLERDNVFPAGSVRKIP